MVYNFMLNSISLPVFFAVSIFAREMEIPALPLESVLELFNNGTFCGCCVASGRTPGGRTACDLAQKCNLGGACHTKRIKDMLVRLMECRAFLPRDSGCQLMWETNCSPYITAYGNDADRCDMTSHELYGTVRPYSSCLRGRPSGTKTSVGSQGGRFGGDGDNDADGEAAGGAGNNQVPGGSCPGGSRVSESAVNNEACRMFAKQSFLYYTKPLAECAMITEGEFCNSVDEFTRMTTKFAQFFGDLPFFGKYKTVMENMKVPMPPSGMEDMTSKQMFEQGQPIIRCRWVCTKN